MRKISLAKFQSGLHVARDVDALQRDRRAARAAASHFTVVSIAPATLLPNVCRAARELAQIEYVASAHTHAVRMYGK